ncbi:hypothetical protein QJS66_09855 [Kocuria rhizophila]|nr:hypothetical protein QJS66_09855 [Kocuria rhizophila]
MEPGPDEPCVVTAARAALEHVAGGQGLEQPLSAEPAGDRGPLHQPLLLADDHHSFLARGAHPPRQDVYVLATGRALLCSARGVCRAAPPVEGERPSSQATEQLAHPAHGPHDLQGHGASHQHGRAGRLLVRDDAPHLPGGAHPQRANRARRHGGRQGRPGAAAWTPPSSSSTPPRPWPDLRGGPDPVAEHAPVMTEGAGLRGHPADARVHRDQRVSTHASNARGTARAPQRPHTASGSVDGAVLNLVAALLVGDPARS